MIKRVTTIQGNQWVDHTVVEINLTLINTWFKFIMSMLFSWFVVICATIYTIIVVIAALVIAILRQAQDDKPTPSPSHKKEGNAEGGTS